MLFYDDSVRRLNIDMFFFGGGEQTVTDVVTNTFLKLLLLSSSSKKPFLNWNYSSKTAMNFLIVFLFI